MSIPTVLRCCQSLEQEGKTVSVALVRAQCASSVPLQDIIAGIKQWRSTPQSQRGPLNTDSALPRCETVSEASLEQRVSSLEAELAQLRAELHQLKRAKPDATDPENRQD